MNGKGDARRPTLVDEATLAGNWERTFGGASTLRMHGNTIVGQLEVALAGPTDGERSAVPSTPTPEA